MKNGRSDRELFDEETVTNAQTQEASKLPRRAVGSIYGLQFFRVNHKTFFPHEVTKEDKIFSEEETYDKNHLKFLCGN